MTAIVGILCRDGVVVGTDSSATFAIGTGQFAFRTIESSSKKIRIIGERIIVDGTGEIGFNQRFCALVEGANNQNLFGPGQLTEFDVAVRLSAAALQNFQSTGVHKGQIDFGCVMAFPCRTSFKLLQFSLQHFQPEFVTSDLWFVSLGSGQPITDPFLGFLRRVFWPPEKKEPPGISEGIFFTTWALLHAIDLNPGGINGPLQLALLKADADENRISPSQFSRGSCTCKESFSALSARLKRMFLARIAVLSS